MISETLRTINSEDTLINIGEGKSLCKTVSISNQLVTDINLFLSDDHIKNERDGLAFIFKQLREPSTYRPIKNTHGRTHTHFRFNYRLNQWEDRGPRGARGLPKNTPFTKKTATTLLPLDGKIRLFSVNHNLRVAPIFNSEWCQLTQYIFNQNAGTDSRFWLGPPTPIESMPKVSTLTEIHEHYRQHATNNRVPAHSELLVKLAKNALIGLSALDNTLEGRLTAQYSRLICMMVLEVNVPLFVITGVDPIFSYTETAQQQDFVNAKSIVENHTPCHNVQLINQLYLAIRDLLNQLPHQTMRDSFLHSSLLPHNPATGLLEFILAASTSGQKTLTLHGPLNTSKDALTRKNHQGKTPIQLAADAGYWNIVQQIAEFIETDNHDSAKYQYACEIALQSGQMEVAFSFMAAGVTFTRLKENQGMILVEYLIKNPQVNTKIACHSRCKTFQDLIDLQISRFISNHIGDSSINDRIKIQEGLKSLFSLKYDLKSSLGMFLPLIFSSDTYNEQTAFTILQSIIDTINRQEKTMPQLNETYSLLEFIKSAHADKNGVFYARVFASTNATFNIVKFAVNHKWDSKSLHFLISILVLEGRGQEIIDGVNKDQTEAVRGIVSHLHETVGHYSKRIEDDALLKNAVIKELQVVVLTDAIENFETKVFADFDLSNLGKDPSISYLEKALHLAIIYEKLEMANTLIKLIDKRFTILATAIIRKKDMVSVKESNFQQLTTGEFLSRNEHVREARWWQPIRQKLACFAEATYLSAEFKQFIATHATISRERYNFLFRDNFFPSCTSAAEQQNCNRLTT